MAYKSGIDFWKKYGRILYNAEVGQNYYNATGQTKPVLRCNTIGRVTDTAVSWANGFFTLYNTTDKYTLIIIPAAPGFNNTLASYDSCGNFLTNVQGAFDIGSALYIPINNYLQPTLQRIQQYVPSSLNLTTLDVYLMQELCTYEFLALGSSDFCSLFTLNEWKSFQYTYDLFTYNGFSFGSQAGRALGLGLLQELLARLQNQFITVSNSSVNTTYDRSANTFPLGQKFYFDATHDFMLTGLVISYVIRLFS